MDARPHFLSREFTVAVRPSQPAVTPSKPILSFLPILLFPQGSETESRAAETGCDGSKEGDGDILLLSDPLARLVESVGTDDAHGEEVVGRAEPARGQVALGIGESAVSLLCIVFDWR